ncbi:MAG TPA: hypothetical protein DCQ13_01090 [Firmicutes bacterium]|nr:hypothetical protein [Bacillota bacterium]
MDQRRHFKVTDGVDRRLRAMAVLGVMAAIIMLPAYGLTSAAEMPDSGDPLSLHDVRPGDGVTRIGCISDYHVSLCLTPVDTRVYYLESHKPGPTALILGGTHANEIAGIMAATLIVANAVVTAGRVIVVPYANNSAASQKDSRGGGPERFYIETPSGVREFRYGDRRTSIVHQGSDPMRYLHHPSRKVLSSNSARDLNRVYPGRLSGNLTEMLAWACIQLIKTEEVDIAIDLHEAGPGSRLADTIIANPKNLEHAVIAVLDANLEGCDMNVEESAHGVPGMSHREWGDATQAASYLIETPNPGQDSGTVNADVVSDPANPLAARVGTHLAAIEAIFSAHEFVDGSRPEWTGLPTRESLLRDGLGSHLR